MQDGGARRSRCGGGRLGAVLHLRRRGAERPRRAGGGDQRTRRTSCALRDRGAAQRQEHRSHLGGVPHRLRRQAPRGLQARVEARSQALPGRGRRVPPRARSPYPERATGHGARLRQGHAPRGDDGRRAVALALRRRGRRSRGARLRRAHPVDRQARALYARGPRGEGTVEEAAPERRRAPRSRPRHGRADLDAHRVRLGDRQLGPLERRTESASTAPRQRFSSWTTTPRSSIPSRRRSAPR